MKKIIPFLLTLILSSNVIGQSNWCGTDQLMQELYEADPDFEQERMKLRLESNDIKVKTRKSNHKIIIPTVIHVVHFNGQGIISDAQLMDGLRIVNEDFNKQNADTISIRSVFSPIAASTDIEFRLAKKDPNQNCTEGITRTNTYLTFGQDDGPSSRWHLLTKNLIQWDPNRYMNVWIVVGIHDASVLGFATPPGGSLNRYGLVVKADEWGSIELAQSTDGRTATHEFGHCLDLDHTFHPSPSPPNSGCGFAGGTCLNSGDMVCDTPPQISDLNNSCSFSFNTCSNDAVGGATNNPNPYTTNVPDQVENFMGYGLTCLSMYTGGQKLRIERAFANPNFTQFATLIDTANLTFTGTKDGYVAPDCVPIAEVWEFDKFTCAGGTIQFTEYAYGGPVTSYNWQFPGGSPSSSNLAQPTITYNTAGTYDVTLIVSNSVGADTLVLDDYVHVEGAQATYSAFNYLESFENATTFANDWTVITPLAPGFDRANFAAKTGSSSLWLNNLNNVLLGAKDQIISPSIKMNDVISPSISIDISYRRKNAQSNDKFALKYSLDCGRTWATILSTTPSFFAFDNSTQTTNFLPTQGSQWKNLTIPANFIPAAVRTSSRVKFMLEVEYADGNNFYFDDFKILGQPVGVAENIKKEDVHLELYPNPAKEQFNLVYHPQAELAQSKIYLTNVIGEKVKVVYEGSMKNTEYKFSVNTSELPKGVYFLSIEGGNNRVTRKVIIH